MKVSNSEISTFLDCRRKWYFKYYRHLQKKKFSGIEVNNLTFGTKVHTALGAWYVSSGQEDPNKIIKSLFHEERPLVQATEDGELIKKFSEQEKMGIMLVGHYMDQVKNEGLDYGFNYISSEEEYEVDLGNDVTFIGKVDGIVEREADGGKYLLEHKTYDPAGATSHLKVAHIEPQHIGYMMLYRMNNDDYLAGTVLNIIRKLKTLTRSKSPIIQREIIRHNQVEIDNYFKRLVFISDEIKGLKDDLDSGQFDHTIAYPTPSTDCSWKCEFFSVCPYVDDGSDWEGMLKEGYEEYDPYERYEVIDGI